LVDATCGAATVIEVSRRRPEATQKADLRCGAVSELPSFVRTPRDIRRWSACVETAQQLFDPEAETPASLAIPHVNIRPSESILGAAIVLFHSELPDDGTT
jgi:hypothetical protein